MIQRYFLILTAGHTGSTWLAKLLNSHFEVMCFHELDLITYTLHWPPQVRAYFEFAPEEKLRNLLYLFSPSHHYGDSYQALGALRTGEELSVRRNLEDVAAYFPDAAARARFFVLTRNPVSQIHSHTDGLVQMAQCVTAPQQMGDFHWKLSRDVLAKMEPRQARALLSEMQRAELDAQYFLHACLHYLRLLWAAQEARVTLPYRSVLRLEDLSHDPTSLRHALKEITGFQYDLPPYFTEKINPGKSGGTPASTLFRSWSPQWRRFFAQVFEPQRQPLESLGYGLGNLTADSATAGGSSSSAPSCETDDMGAILVEAMQGTRLREIGMEEPVCAMW